MTNECQMAPCWVERRLVLPSFPSRNRGGESLGLIARDWQRLPTTAKAFFRPRFRFTAGKDPLRLAYQSCVNGRLMYVIWIQSWRPKSRYYQRNGNCNLLNFGSLGFGLSIALAIPLHRRFCVTNPTAVPQWITHSIVPLMLCGS